MATIHTGATLTPSKVELLTAWIGSQRWYAAKGRTPQLRRLFSWRLDDPAGEVGLESIVIADDATTPPLVYQIPLTYRGTPLPGGEHALVGTLDHSVLGHRYVYDAPHDPVYAERLFALATGAAEAVSSTTDDTPEEAVSGTGVSQGWRLISSRVLSGEQSNTSIIGMAVDADGGVHPVITKVFRALAAGENPDVVLQGALAAAGCTRVPASLGAISGAWPSADGGQAHGHLAFAQEFLPGAQDAWREALTAAGSATSFAARAKALGEATAEVPPLATYRDDIDAVYAAAEAAQWPDFQRIHGDYHLGQVLDIPDRGWVLLDFEGEPLRPLAERTRTDQPLRDVAGMLRSFDYAGGSVEQGTRGLSTRDWVAEAQQSFLDGYTSVSGRDPRTAGPLLDAFLVDKALYEVVYEARNRPAWIDIPLTAIDRLFRNEDATKEDQP